MVAVRIDQNEPVHRILRPRNTVNWFGSPPKYQSNMFLQVHILPVQNPYKPYKTRTSNILYGFCTAVQDLPMSGLYCIDSIRSVHADYQRNLLRRVDTLRSLLTDFLRNVLELGDFLRGTIL